MQASAPTPGREGGGGAGAESAKSPYLGQFFYFYPLAKPKIYLRTVRGHLIFDRDGNFPENLEKISG